MREFELVIDEALKNGLSPLRVTPMNSQLLRECLGFRLGKVGLEKYEDKENPIDAIDILYSWPFPQYLVGERYNILVVRDSLVNHEDIVYVVSDDHVTVTHIFSIDVLTFGQGTLMEMADFGEYIFMANGVRMIYWDPTLVAWQHMAASATIPMMKTVCNFKGQAVGGNVVSAWHDCDEKSYVWSKIGSIDFTPEDDNEAGYRRDPFGGEVYHTRRLGDMVVGYSSEGITALTPVGSPVTTFRFTELSNIGLINQGAMDGDLRRHVYLGEDQILREITNEGIKELGYEFFMGDLEGEDVIVSYDKKLEDFYIGNSKKTFLLSPKGLTEIPQHPSAVWRRNKETYCLPETVDNYDALIVTSPFDMGYAGQKTVFSMETDILFVKDPEVAVSYYNDITTFGTTDYVPLNDQNIAAIIVSGNAFDFRLRYDPLYDNSRLSYIVVRYKMTDLRGIRGVYAPAPRGQRK